LLPLDLLARQNQTGHAKLPKTLILTPQLVELQEESFMAFSLRPFDNFTYGQFFTLVDFLDFKLRTERFLADNVTELLRRFPSSVAQ